jgi:hypothetical protein
MRYRIPGRKIVTEDTNLPSGLIIRWEIEEGIKLLFHDICPDDYVTQIFASFEHNGETWETGYMFNVNRISLKKVKADMIAILEDYYRKFIIEKEVTK